MSTKYKIHNPEAVYFITFSTVQWVDIFTRDCYRKIVSESLNYCVANKGLIIYAWVLMTNHVHLVCRSNVDSKLSDIMRDLKKFTAVQIVRELTANYQESRKGWLQWLLRSSANESSSNKNYQVWQHDNHPIELDTTYFVEQKIDYIHHNPVRAGFVTTAEAWQYSSARDFAGEQGFVTICPV
ncbi:transposase [uncultured Draconibacterium sp.]|uniref:REP-associated tyrosine transposase n=1 Tax=uncultured Draconibacterium sp. TaxID=1573823 RepID=UPI0032613F78